MIMMNITVNNYPYFTYIPSRFSSIIFAILVYCSLLGWLLQCLYVKYRPFRLTFFIFMSHLVTFIELVFRATLDVDVRSTKTLYIVTTVLLVIGPRLLLLANFHCLVEIRGKKARHIIDRILDIVVPVGVIGAGVLFGIANHLSFQSERVQLSFRLRQISSAFIVILSVLFYAVWYLSVSHAHRRYVLLLLSVSSICVLIEAVYIQVTAVHSFFFPFNNNELWFYVGHLIPIALALVSWSIFYPCEILPQLETTDAHDETSQEMLSSIPKI